jgi:site-specific recombinase XerD
MEAMSGARSTKRGVVCSSCRSELVEGTSCPTHGERNADGTSPYRTNRGRRFGPERLSDEEVQAILAQCGRDSLTGIRNKAMIATLWRTGIRSAELLALRPKDVDEAAGHLVVMRGKGDKQRTVGIDADALTLIARWMDRRKEKGIRAHAALFCSLHSTPLPTSYLRELLPRLAAKAGLKRRVSPHMLRHSLAYDLMMEDRPLVEIQAQLGHANAAVTSRYLDHLAPKQVVRMIHSRPSWLQE